MIGLLQRVTHASVRIDENIVARIDAGLLVLVAVTPEDTAASGARLVEKLLNYRVFADNLGKMNLNLQQIAGGLLLVPQFTLAADTRHGLRPGFSTAASPLLARGLFEALVEEARSVHPQVECGVFGADMQVALVNDGPVTFWLES